MSKHTPGPWNYLNEECDRPYIRIRGIVPGTRYKIANVLTPMYEGVHPREAEETRANSRLIAAAPELYALANRIARLNKDAGEIGAGMLASLVDEANRIIEKVKK